MSPLPQLATLFTLLVVPTHVAAHAGHGWEGLSHASQHLLSALVAVLAVAGVATLLALRTWWRVRRPLRPQPQQQSGVMLPLDDSKRAPAKPPCASN